MSRLRCVLFIFIFCAITFTYFNLLYSRVPAKTIQDFNSSGNLKHTWKKRKCPQGGIVSIKSGGRLGNRMWQYTTIWAISKVTGLEAYIPQCILSNLSRAFNSLKIPALEEISHCPIDVESFAKSLDEWNKSTNERKKGILIPSNLYYVKLALAWPQDIRELFTFRKELIHKSQEILRSLATNRADEVFVGVHVRRTDYASFLHTKYSLKSADIKFYYSAMRYFKDKYKNVIFVVLSDDVDWCFRRFNHLSNVHVVGKLIKSSPHLDLAILASCNHSLIDYGTYGEWAAILAGGETIFYNNKKGFNPIISKILPNWYGFT